MHISQEYFGEPNHMSILRSTHANPHLDLNGSHYETIGQLPTSLEFSQMVRISRPVLIKGLAL